MNVWKLDYSPSPRLLLNNKSFHWPVHKRGLKETFDLRNSCVFYISFVISKRVCVSIENEADSSFISNSNYIPYPDLQIGKVKLVFYASSIDSSIRKYSLLLAFFGLYKSWVQCKAWLQLSSMSVIIIFMIYIVFTYITLLQLECSMLTSYEMIIS